MPVLVTVTVAAPASFVQIPKEFDAKSKTMASAMLTGGEMPDGTGVGLPQRSTDWAAAPGAGPASSGRHSRAASNPRRNRRTPSPPWRRAEAGLPEEEDSGGEDGRPGHRSHANALMGGSAALRLCGSAALRLCGSAALRLCGSVALPL